MVKVRFAPSPTGYLHIGGARTALFNYLFAKKNNGKFIVRIEDTDKERSTRESVDKILDSLRWMGLEWDEGPEAGGENGPYFQSQRADIYKKYIDKLIEEKKVYKCYCTKDELDALREKAKKDRTAFRYPGTCRNAAEREGGGEYTLRLKTPAEGETVVKDIVRGDVVFKNDVIDDFIIARGDGSAMYNFVVTVDDALMGITHVIRGEDHLSNTPKQAQIYKALGFNVPLFAHIPLILGPDKSRLSKRHGATSVGDYRDRGILPEAFLNALALLGWSYDDKTEMFSKEELEKLFDLSRVHKSGAMFDNTKMEYFNGIYIRKMDIDSLTEKCIPHLKEAGLIDENTDREFIKSVVRLQQEKIRTFRECADISVYFFRDDYEMNEAALKVWEKNKEQRGDVLKIFKEFIKEDKWWSKDTVYNKNENSAGKSMEEALKETMAKAEIKPKVYMHTIRAVLTGTTTGPGLFDIISVMGKEKVLKRIQKYESE
ncbi:MAG: glutamate--tRNA ligase [Candidatus Goldiibacteriota bacterium]